MRRFLADKHANYSVITLLVLLVVSFPNAYSKDARVSVKSLYIPLADHYAALVAYERYRYKMKRADFQIEKLKNGIFFEPIFNRVKLIWF